MDEEFVVLKISTSKPEFVTGVAQSWQIMVTDVKTGKLLPVYGPLTIRVDKSDINGLILADVTLLITELDLENIPAHIRAKILKKEKQ